MQLSPEFIGKARALAFYRKLKVRRARQEGEGGYADTEGLAGWRRIGAGHFGEAWQHAEHGSLVVKISGRGGFGYGSMGNEEPRLDGWPVFAQHCQANPHPNLPNILHFERLSVGISWGVMPRYESVDIYSNSCDEEIVTEWRDYLEGEKGAPEWLWPIIGMRGALGMEVDLHRGNVMLDTTTGEYIMTDPFSFVD